MKFRLKISCVFIIISLAFLVSHPSAFQDHVMLNDECQRKALLMNHSPTLLPISAKSHVNKRVAVMVRGDAYRNWNGQYVNASCCTSSRQAQSLVAGTHINFAKHLLEEYGMETDFFIATYCCTNGKDYVEKHLPSLYGSALKQMVILNRSETAAHYKGGSQWDIEFGSAGRVVSLLREYISANKVKYHHLFSIRLDSFFSVHNFSECAFPKQVFEAGRPVSTREFIAHGRDEVLYLPGLYLDCWWYQLSNPVKYAQYQSGYMFDVTLKLSGMSRQMGLSLPRNGLRPFSMYKLTPQVIAEKTKDRTIGIDCMCGKWLWTLDASNTKPLHMDKDGLVREYTASGSPTRNCSSYYTG